MPHYSDSKNVLSQPKSNIGEILVKKVNAGTYVKLYKDKDGILKGERFILHDEQARENAKAIDSRIDNAEKDIANYEAYQNKLDSMGTKLDKAIAEHEESERKALEAEDELNKKEAELNNAQNELNGAVERTNELMEQINSYPNPDDVPQELLDAAQDAEAQVNQCQENVSSKENEVSAAEGAFNEALDQQESTFGKMSEMNNAYKDAVAKAPPEPNFTQKDVNVAKSQTTNAQSSSGNSNFGQAATSNGSIRQNIEIGGIIPGSDSTTINSNDLFDLRSIGKAGINFRGIGKAQNVLSKAEYTFSPSRSYYLNDYRFADSLTLNNDMVINPKVQPIILNEFQPYDMLSPADVLDGVGNLLVKFAMTPFGAGTAPIVKTGAYFLSKSLIDRYSSDTSKLYGSGTTRERKYFTTDPVQVIQNMFNGGRWLNTYELPYFGNSYLKAAYSQKWTTGDSSNFLGALAGSEKDVGTKMLGIDFPSNPKFKAPMSEGRDQIQLSFYLINTDNNWLVRNFQFLNAIYAGANWLHLKGCVIRPPNVYHVLCPGRFQIYWAAIDVTVTFEGKLRKNEAVSNELRKYSKAIKSDMLWPDAWKIIINIRDLTPNNFNLYAEYYQNGLNTTEVTKLEQVMGVSDIIKQAKEYLTELTNDAKEAGKAAIDSGAKAMNSFSDMLKK